ncbi:MAG: heavy-metal-associated domain-containing protein [Chlorobi bacterium]|nr:heavy-metal-associated domain-containing protein [Chlorobiota bacterium]
MKELKFKTNITCNGCKATVTPFLNKETGIKNWEVDLTSKDRILTIQADGITPAEIINVLKTAGYNSEIVN